ncbi:MAG: MaoC family dehydratase [Candidatus Longimicrobiales bacterium M2_2A_002]
MERLEGLTIRDLEVGRAAEFTKTISEADVYGFAGITGDFNPVHVDQVAAEASRFGGRIAHGMLTAALISTVIGMKLPGPGCIYMSQSLRFNAPVRFGDTITARAEVKDINIEKNRITLATACLNQDGDVVAEGESLVMPRKA